MTSDVEKVQDTGRLSRLNDRERRRAAAAVRAPAQGRYLAIGNGEETVRIPLEAEVTRLGRGMTADVHLDDPTVSRRHALIVVRDEHVVLLDDRSMNGTWLNGERIREAPLSDGDAVMLGSVLLHFVDVPA